MRDFLTPSLLFHLNCQLFGVQTFNKKTKSESARAHNMLFQWETSSAPAKGFPCFSWATSKRTLFFFCRGWRTQLQPVFIGFCAETGLGNFHISLPLGLKRNIDEHLSIKFVGKNTLFNLDLFGHGAWKK